MSMLDVIKSMDNNMSYILMKKNVEVCSIDIYNGKVSDLINESLPFNLYLEEGDDIDRRINNISSFSYWCASRLLTLDRTHAKAILNACGLKQATTDKDRMHIALKYRCLSLKDFFWVKQESENINWEEVNLFSNSLNNALIDLSLQGRGLTINRVSDMATDLSTSGVCAKGWQRQESKLFLLKGDSKDKINKEYRASNVLSLLGFNSAIYSKCLVNNEEVLRVECFTSDDEAFVTAGEYRLNKDLANLVSRFSTSFHELVLACYLTGNSDLHEDNWGFLYNDSMEVIKMTPIFDFDHCFESNECDLCLPLYVVYGNKLSQLEAARYALQELGISKSLLLSKVNDEYVSKRIQLI